jgi:Tfp pilus assembly protein PilP
VRTPKRSPVAVWLVALGLSGAVLPVPAPVLGQQAAGAQEQGRESPEAAAELDDIDQLLEGEEEILAGEGFSYDPAGRRDPFKSLLAASETVELRGPRPEGIPGLLIDEIVITGTFRTDAGYVAQVQSAESQKSFLLKQGDQLYDGDVVRISGNEIVFKQIVQDPTALKPFREVVKTLNPEKG